MAYDNNYGYAQNGYTQYFDMDGKPLTGGTLSTFIAGTTTPVLTFKDFNGGQNPHKITLDENGGATVILKQDIVYKFIIRDKNGDIFKTIDNIVTGGTTTVVEGDAVTISGKEGEIAVDYSIDTKEYSIKLDNTILAKLDEKEVFFCRYNNTSYSDIRDAYNAKKLIVMYKSQYNFYEYFLLDARDPHAFQFKKVEKNRITFFTIDDENGWLESYQNYEVDAQIPTIEHILDLSTLDEENSTFDVVLTANRNNAISFVETSEQTATVAIEIEDAKSYHIQIAGACTLALTGVEWWSDVITDIANKAEINIMNGRAIGGLIDV